jgi:transcriptional regulator with XRE-family HTH domain
MHIWYIATNFLKGGGKVSPLLTWHLLTMDFGKRLAALRKERSLTQATLAEKVGCHITMIRRYEVNETQPTLDIIRKLAIALSVSADTLVFDEAERSPSDDLLLQFEAVSHMPDDERRIIKALLDGMIMKYQTRKMVSSLSS